MNRLQLGVRAFCVVPFITGAIDLLNGVGLLKSVGVPLSPEAASDPVLNSQIKFWGAIWLGYGILLWRSTYRLREEPDVFRILCGILGLSGIGRLAAAVQYGNPGPPLTGAMAIELIGSVALYRWHAVLLQRPGTQ